MIGGQGAADYVMSGVAQDRQKADELALYLIRAGKTVFCLWSNQAKAMPHQEVLRLVRDAARMIVVYSDAYQSVDPWEWSAFGGGAGGIQKTLVLACVDEQNLQSSDSPSFTISVIDLHTMGADPRRDERIFLSGLGLPVPQLPTAPQSIPPSTPAPPVPSQVFCLHCGAANHSSKVYCYSCGRPLGVPRGPSIPPSTLLPPPRQANSAGMRSVPASPPSMAGQSSLFCDQCGLPNRPSALFCAVCGNPMRGGRVAASANGPLSAANLLQGRYLIVKQIGKGGYGAVYQAEDTRFGNRLLAVKEMSQDGLVDAQTLNEATAAFEREAMLLASLMNPRLPRIYDHFLENGRWYLVMDFIEGETLAEYLQQAQAAQRVIAVEEVLDIAQQLCAVLSYLHGRTPPIIFRDLKPANIMRANDGHLYLIDFGIARHFKPGQTRDTSALGSPGYAAPEQYGRGQTTERSDLYALGALIHQLLSGDDPSEQPFSFRPLGQIRQDLHQGLVTLVASLLEMDADKRPASAKQVRDALSAIAAAGLAGLPPSLPSPAQATVIGGGPGVPLYVYQEHAPRKVNACSLSPDGKLIASVGEDGTLRVWEASTGSQVYKYTLQPFSYKFTAWSPRDSLIIVGGPSLLWRGIDPFTRQDTRLPYLQDRGRKMTALAWSPRGQRFALATELGAIGVGWRLNEDRLHWYQGHQPPSARFAVRAIAFSPDERHAVSGDDAGVVHVWGLDSIDSPQRTYQGHRSPIIALAWSPDERLIASSDTTGGVQVWEAATCTPLFAYEGHGALMAVRSLVFSPDGKRIASGGDDGTVQVWEAATGQCAHLFQGHTGQVNTVCWSVAAYGTRIASASDDGTVRVWQAV